jgi:shikimate kinase
LPAFRDAEGRALREVLAGDDRVVSLGGGTPTAPEVEALITSHRAAGRVRVIFIDADVATIRARIVADGPSARPPILGRDSVEEVEELLQARRPIYLRIADFRVEPKGGDPVGIARTLGAMVRNALA